MTEQEYFDQFHGMDQDDRPRREEWEICGCKVRYRCHYSPTGSSSDAWEGFYISRNGRHLFNIERPYRDYSILEPLIKERIKKYTLALEEIRDQTIRKINELINDEI